ncbi:titin homolog isoform X2 [Polistes fuscatus]|uniref:titin homolog isoform X2 n=1 Tax=Polistes fuscatus TaxID=30207 RepID=UPI001CA95EE3|nr:titin homolog isoform X2 [Polistes fuscatus]
MVDRRTECLTKKKRGLSTKWSAFVKNSSDETAIEVTEFTLTEARSENMSSSYIVEPQEKETQKQDDTLIIVVSDDGTISVDQETLHNLIMNQSNANVSVVRLGQSEPGANNGDITLTVDPPTFASSNITPIGNATTTDASGLVDPFMEMDPEQLERLETALQSEEAKQILGENVTAMLDMLSVEEQQKSIRYSVELDHCYTNKLPDSEPKDSLPLSNYASSSDIQYTHSPSPSTVSTMSLPSNEVDKQKTNTKTGKPIGRPRKNPLASNQSTSPRSAGNSLGVSKSTGNSISKAHRLSNDEEEEEEGTPSPSESSESEPSSDNDLDFGPRGPRRGGLRARGGRKGLTTRGGHITGRRRNSNKHLDIEQVRRLDMEMAAAVTAMKTSEKEEKIGLTSARGRRQFKTFGVRKKDETQHMQASPASNEATINTEKHLQTTNQVKANLISSNMIKGDMILTKPGQGRNNQKLTLVQKQVVMKASELKNMDVKKSMILPKGKFLNQVQTKLISTKDGKLMHVPIASKSTVSSAPIGHEKGTIIQTTPIQQYQGLQQQGKPISSIMSVKVKPSEIKKERKKSEKLTDLISKTEDMKKHSRKEHKKSPGFVADTLGPALFSAPDIIRRVGSNNDPKNVDNPATTLIANIPSSPISCGIAKSSAQGTQIISSTNVITTTGNITQSSDSEYTTKTLITNTLEEDVSHVERHSGTENDTDNVLKDEGETQETDSKANATEELQTSLITTSSQMIDQAMALPTVSNNINTKPSGIEGEEHLLATLEMEANKHDEELLAEALLLQEELGVDLEDHTALVEQPVPSTSLTSTPAQVTTLETTTNQELTRKSLDTTTTAQISPNITPEVIKKNIKDDKEPIQIVRGGRVITLPPIEAPATRSKRLQAKTEVVQKTPEPIKKVEHYESPAIQSHIERKEGLNINEQNDDDDEDDDDEEEENSDSEDDPDRLWCICKRPHNNRFMICCDVCEDWFHGKCVHVSKAMGQQMEEKGIEWVCPNCLKKKADDNKVKTNAQVMPGREKQQQDSFMEDSSSLMEEETLQPALSQTKDGQLSAASTLDHNIVRISGTTQCVVCKKEARNSSIYCSDACILAHAQETLTKDKPIATGSNSKMLKQTPLGIAKAKADARVIVFERRSGRLLTGTDAPKRSNLKTWLKENPTFEAVRADSLSQVEIGGKTLTVLPAQRITKPGKSPQLIAAKAQAMPKMVYTNIPGSKQTILIASKKITTIPVGNQQQTSTMHNKPHQLKQTFLDTSKGNLILKQTTIRPASSPQNRTQGTIAQKQIPNKKQEVKVLTPQPKQQAKIPLVRKPETEPIRLNIRKTLTELLSSRIKETDDLKLTDEEIADLAFNIEMEMYKYFKDTGAKYKAKYRSLVFNIKDTKNLTLFRKIANKSLAPDAVVRLSPDEMASQELAEWREKETKHQLEMIKKNELDLMAQAKSIVVKTHKGEQIIENDGSIGMVDPKTPVQDIVTALNSGDSVSSIDTTKEREDGDRIKMTAEMKRSKNGEEGRKKDKEREGSRDSGRLRSKEGRERSTSRNRHRHKRDRDYSKTRERSKDRKIKSKESRREKDKEREKDKDKQRNKDREKIKDREKEKERERERERERDRERDRDRDRDRDREKEKEKYLLNDKEKHKTIDVWAKARIRNESSKEIKNTGEKKEQGRKKDMEKKKESTPPISDKPIEDRLWRHIEDEATTNTIDGNDSDVSDREPSSTVTIKTPDINEEPERYTDPEIEKDIAKTSWQTVWRGFVNMVDVAKFFITAQEVSGHARDLMNDLPDTVDVVGRISHETVWDYISKMKKTGSKEILVIRLTAANDEEKIPYITLYSYLNSRSRLGVVGNVSKNIKDFYIMPFSNQSTIPRVLLPLTGPGFEENRPHLLLGIIVRNRKKRLTAIPPIVSTKIQKKDPDRSYTPPLVGTSKDKNSSTTPPASPMGYKATATDTIKDKQTVTQMTLENLNKAHIGMSKSVMDSAAICKIVPELSTKIDLIPSPLKTLDDDGDEPYSPGEMDEDATNIQTAMHDNTDVLSSAKNSTELQRKMDELNRQIEEQKQQIQNISSSFLNDATPTLPGLGLDPPNSKDSEEAYSPSDTRSFTPPPPGLSKFAQPILDKVSDITIPPNLQEILANVKRQESSKVDPYLPSKPSATFLTTVNSTVYHSSEKYSSPSQNKGPNLGRTNSEKAAFMDASQTVLSKESKSTLSKLSDLDLIRKAEEELAAVAAASAVPNVPTVPISPVTPSGTNLLTQTPAVTPTQCGNLTASPTIHQPILSPPIAHIETSFKKTFAPEQPKPPGLEDEDFPAFPSTPPTMDTMSKMIPRSKYANKSGIVLSVKRKISEDDSSPAVKTSRTKSRWGQGPSE